MRHITVAPTLNEYDVDDEFFVIYESGIPMYNFVVIDTDRDGTENKSMLVVPVAAVAEMHIDYNDKYITMMRDASEAALKGQMQRIADQQQKETEPEYTEGVEDNARRDYI